MNIQKQICSLKLSLKLKELGVLQDSMFYWVSNSNPNTTVYSVGMQGSFNENYHQNDMISAFTADELFKILPDRIDTHQNEPFNNFKFNMQRSIIVEESTPKPTFLINYNCDTIQVDSGSPFFALHLIKHNIWDEKLANAVAKTLIYLIEEGFLIIKKEETC